MSNTGIAIVRQKIERPIKKPKTIGVLAIILVGIVLYTTGCHSLLMIAGLALPVMYFYRKDFLYLFPVVVITAMKIGLAYNLDPDGNYASYALNEVWMLREASTLILCYSWLTFGRRHIDPQQILNLKPWLLWVLIVMAYGCLGFYENSIIVSGVSSLHRLLLLVFYLILTGRYNLFFKFSILALILATALIPMQSSFTVISSASLILLFLITKSRLADKIIPWRPIVMLCIAFLMLSSAFAYLVHVRATRANGEGNNGYTRAILADAGYQQFLETPVFGTPYGRGILPLKTVEKLGWMQYFTDTETYNIYNLSFHDSFIYLLTRYGIFSLLLFYMLTRLVPKKGRLTEVLFSCVFLLSAGANVVMESLRAGPGFGFALGIILALGQYRYEATAKEKFERASTSFVSRPL